MVSRPSFIADTTVSFEKQYHFVDPADRHHRRKARAFVAVERLRELRFCSNSGKQDTTSQQLKPSIPCVKSSNVLATNQTKKRQYGHRIKLRAMALGKEECRNHVPRFVGSGSLDPFQILPIELSPEVHLLVDHYTKVIPTLLPISVSTCSQQHQLAVDLFRLYCLHPASFLGMLYHSARHRESIHDDDCTAESLSLVFKVKTLREVNKQIEKAKCQGMHPDNGTIMAIYLLSVAERMWGDVNTFRMHWRAMYDIIDAKGGAESFTDDNLMYAKALWNCFALLNARDGYFNCPRIALSAGGNYDFRIPADSMIKNCHCFLQTYTDRKASILQLLPNTEAESLLQDEVYPRRATAFQPGRVFHQILRPHYNEGTEEQFDTTKLSNRFIQIPGDRCRTDNCRLACVIYLNLVLAELGDFSKDTELFLSALEQTFTKNTQMLSPEYLLWVLLRTPVPLSSRTAPGGLWAKVIQIIAVVKRARFHNVVQYQEAMFLFLQLAKDASKLAPALKVDLGTIQEEALGDGFKKATTDGLHFGFMDVFSSDVNAATHISHTYCELLWFAGGS